MSNEVPETIRFFLWLAETWQYFMAGLFSLAGVAVVIRKGKNDRIAIIPLSEKHIDNKILLAENVMREELRKEFKSEINDMKEDMLQRIELMIEASK